MPGYGCTASIGQWKSQATIIRLPWGSEGDYMHHLPPPDVPYNRRYAVDRCWSEELYTLALFALARPYLLPQSGLFWRPLGRCNNYHWWCVLRCRLVLLVTGMEVTRTILLSTHAHRLADLLLAFLFGSAVRKSGQFTQPWL